MHGPVTAASLSSSAAVRVGPILSSGQPGTNSTCRLVPGGTGPETAQALANSRTLAEGGAPTAWRWPGPPDRRRFLAWLGLPKFRRTPAPLRPSRRPAAGLP